MQENSLMNITDFNIQEMTPKTATALDIHTRILSAEQTAATAMITLCENLKKMRDDKLYLSLNFETFDDYTEQACGIKRRQAYNYIQTYEKLGKDVLQSNANLGITKLQLLTEVCAVDREDFIEENDLEGMSVAEVKKLVAENQQRGEQLNLLEAELDKERMRADKAEDEILLLENENQELKNRPVEVAVAEPSKEDIDKAVADIKKDYENQIKALKKEKSDAVKKAKEEAVKNAETEKNKAVEKAKSEEKDRLSSFYEKRIADAENSKKEALKKAEEMSARLTNSADTELVTANVYFTTAQEQLTQFKNQALKIKQSNPEKGEKLIKLVTSILQAFITDLNNL